MAANFTFFLIATVQTPGLDPPPDSAALFIFVTTAGTISHHLLREMDTIGYPAAIDDLRVAISRSTISLPSR